MKRLKFGCKFPSKWLSFQSQSTLESHNAMADQALLHEKVFKGLANLLVEEVYRQLRGDAVQSLGLS